MYLLRSVSVLLLVVLTAVGLAQGKGARASDFGQLSASGYVHVQWVSDFRAAVNPTHSFDLRRMRLKFHYIPSDIGACIELGCDRLSPSVEDAFIQYRVGPGLGFVAGLRKMPFSREELTPASRLPAIERGLSNDLFGDLGYLGRDIGLCVEGELFSSSLPVTYAAGVFNGNRARRSRDYNNAKQFCERVTAKPRNWLTLGLSGTQRNDSVTGKRVGAYGADFRCTPRRLTFEGEVLVGNSAPGKRMLGTWLVLAQRIGSLEPGLRAERLYPDLGAAGMTVTELAAFCNWYLHRRMQLKVNLIADKKTKDWQGPAVLVQAQVSF
ncbi:hypothetical protein FJY70_00705 [candidate division WOR-3 bacterium]|nr:hypothetical protein [candidate division WOR-3 bacterium]